MEGPRFDFGGAHVLVTGGTGGIGLAVARAFAGAGAAVTVTGTRAGPGDYDHAAELRPFTYRPLRLGDPDSVDALAGGLDRLTVLVNNAGQNLPGGRDEYRPEVFDEVVASNLTGAYRLTAACRPLLAAADGASVVNLASLASFFGVPFVPAYAAAKAGVVALTRTLAMAWAPHGIRVNAVAPGVIETNMTAPMLGIEALTAPLLARTPAGRLGTPEDVAPAVLFLASPAARYITGTTLMVDGGFSVAG